MTAKPTSRLPKWIIPFIILFIAAGIVALLTSTKPETEKKESQEQEWLVNTEEVSFAPNSPELEVLGVVEAPFATSLAAVISTEVKAVEVLEGEQVKKGQLLVQLDIRDIALVVKQRKADVEELDAQIQSEINRHSSDIKALESEKSLLEVARKALKRQAKLSEANLVAQERYEAAQSELSRQELVIINRELNIADHPQRLAQLKARRSKAKTSLADAQLDQEKSAVKAPFDGIVTSVPVAPGDRVNVNQTLVELYDSSTVEIRAQLPNHSVNNVRQALNSGETLKARSANSSFELVRLSGQANNASGGVDAFFRTIDSKHSLSLNSTHGITLVLPEIENTLEVPLSAIYGTNRMYLVEEGRLKSVTVDVLGRVFTEAKGQGNEGVIVSSSELTDGQTFIVTQLPNAISGLKVKARQ